MIRREKTVEASPPSAEETAVSTRAGPPPARTGMRTGNAPTIAATARSPFERCRCRRESMVLVLALVAAATSTAGATATTKRNNAAAFSRPPPNCGAKGKTPLVSLLRVYPLRQPQTDRWRELDEENVGGVADETGPSSLVAVAAEGTSMSAGIGTGIGGAEGTLQPRPTFSGAPVPARMSSLREPPPSLRQTTDLESEWDEKASSGGGGNVGGGAVGDFLGNLGSGLGHVHHAMSNALLGAIVTPPGAKKITSVEDFDATLAAEIHAALTDLEGLDEMMGLNGGFGLSSTDLAAPPPVGSSVSHPANDGAASAALAEVAADVAESAARRVLNALFLKRGDVQKKNDARESKTGGEIIASSGTWTARIDEARCLIYYHDSETGMSTWTAPPELAGKARLSAAKKTALLAEGHQARATNVEISEASTDPRAAAIAHSYCPAPLSSTDLSKLASLAAASEASSPDHSRQGPHSTWPSRQWDVAEETGAEEFAMYAASLRRRHLDFANELDARDKLDTPDFP